MKISVIVPVYNAEKYLNKCIESVLAQTYPDWELILVDDGSKDGSADIIDGYAASDTRIKAIHQENAGPGMARNRGIEDASGDYITFLDSDDYLSDDFYEQMRPLMEQAADCIIFDYQFVSDSGKKLGNGHSIDSNILHPGLMERKSAFVYTFGSTGGKLYNRKVLFQYNIKFAELFRCEDMPFTKIALARCSSIYYLPKRLYNYVQVESSLMHNAALNDERNCQRAFDMVLEQLDDAGMDEELIAVELREVLNNSVQIMIGRGCTNREIIDFISKHYKIEHLKNRYVKKYPVYVRMMGWLAYFHCIFPIRLMWRIKKWIKERR